MGVTRYSGHYIRWLLLIVVATYGTRSSLPACRGSRILASSCMDGLSFLRVCF